MTDDIVKRLRYGLIDTNTSYRYQQEAADEIEKLREARDASRMEVIDVVRENEKLRAALKPFADEAGFIRPEAHDGDWYELDTVTVGEFRAAKAALGESDE